MAWVHSGCVTLYNCHGLSEVQLLHSKTARLLWELKTESRFMCFCIHKRMVLPPWYNWSPPKSGSAPTWLGSDGLCPCWLPTSLGLPLDTDPPVAGACFYRQG